MPLDHVEDHGAVDNVLGQDIHLGDEQALGPNGLHEAVGGRVNVLGAEGTAAIGCQHLVQFLR